MAILPDLIPDLQEQVGINSQENPTQRGTSLLFDFNAGDFVTKDGKLLPVDGLESLKIWIEKILKTEKFRFKIYETGETSPYGVTLLDLINGEYPRAFIESEIQREVSEALLRNPEIKEVSGFTFSRAKRGLSVAFSVNTIYGTAESEVII
ncbi:MAG: DUF2634 domain-containing protein [Desulfitobacterium sp.]